MKNKILRVSKGSPAERHGVFPGYFLLAVGGRSIGDVLDYKFYTYERSVRLTLEDPSGAVTEVSVRKREGEDLGLEFESYLMDKPSRCSNKCVFCFIDQLPGGMRDTLYFKDDDARLSLLTGNYITLTNLSAEDIARIKKMRISPINISVHTTNPELRVRMLGNSRAGDCLGIMKSFAEFGILMNCQIVLCPGFNDGGELTRTLRDLAALFPSVASVSVVPVGLTKHREGLCHIPPVTREAAREAIASVNLVARECLEHFGTRVVFCADELYLKAGLSIPRADEFEDFPQLENGVGTMALFEREFREAAASVPPDAGAVPFTVFTGTAAAPYMRRLLDFLKDRCHNIIYDVIAVQNRFFGETVNVAGLVTGGDILDAAKSPELSGRALIPSVMLRHEGDLFLDGVSLEELSETLGIPVIPVPVDGGALIDEIFKGS